MSLVVPLVVSLYCHSPSKTPSVDGSEVDVIQAGLQRSWFHFEKRSDDQPCWHLLSYPSGSMEDELEQRCSDHLSFFERVEMLQS